MDSTTQYHRHKVSIHKCPCVAFYDFMLHRIPNQNFQDQERSNAKFYLFRIASTQTPTMDYFTSPLTFATARLPCYRLKWIK